MELLDTVVSTSALLTFFFTVGGFCIKVFTQRPAEEVLTEWVHSSQPLAQATPSPASAVASPPTRCATRFLPELEAKKQCKEDMRFSVEHDLEDVVFIWWEIPSPL